MYSRLTAVLLLWLVLVACQLPNSRDATPTARIAEPTPGTNPPRVAYLWQGPPPSGIPMMEVFHAALPEYGWHEGTDLIFESVSVDNQVARYPEVIAALVASHPTVIVVGDSAAAPLVAEATTEIPIVLILGGNVVAAGQACSVSRPCGNVTGLSLSLAPLSPKRLEMLKDVAPSVRRVGFLRNSAIPETELELHEVQAAGATLGVEIVPLQFRTPADFANAFREGVEQEIDGLLVMPDGVTTPNRQAILRFTAEHALPDGYGVNLFARDGGLFSYGADREYNFRRAAYYVDRLLRGTRPTELPIEQPSRFELTINLTRAEQLGLAFPSHMLLDAREAVR